MKIFITILIIIAALYAGICAILYFKQESLIFFPQKLSSMHQFDFPQKHEEVRITTADGLNLHGVLFKADSSNGLIFYLHGNGGAVDSWGAVADTYLRHKYDVFFLDYRGYGKSEGFISSEDQFYSDAQLAYDKMKQRYNEKRMIVLGYSIGTGTAAYLASVNRPSMLILQAPYFNLTHMMKHYYKILPGFVLKYKFDTDKYVRSCKMPVVVFHGDADEVIYYGSSLKLKTLFKPGDRLITLNGAGHKGLTENEQYQIEIEKSSGSFNPLPFPNPDKPTHRPVLQPSSLLILRRCSQRL